jgi:hypothetical protein
MARILSVDGEVIEVQPADGREFTVAEMEKLVGGEFDLIRTDMGASMAIDENARAKGLDLNRRASMMTGQFVIGPAVLLKPGEFLIEKELVAVAD